MITYQTRVYYEDTDCAGVVYHSQYLNWMERGRTEALYQHELTFSDFQDSGFVVTQCHIDFKRPAKLGDMIVIESCISAWQPCSIVWQQVVQKDSQTLCVANITTALLGNNWRPKRISETFRSLLAPLAHHA